MSSEIRAAGSMPDHVMIGIFSDPATTMAVTWRTDVNVGTCRIRLRLADGAEEPETLFFDAKSRLLQTDDGDSLLWHVHLEGLEPGSRYAYSVENADTGEATET
ncbi:MAG: fibronectin type III domain-containing protein, partial [Clostridia bacterium]|nr:fibronectin type III domain-containing protein [Clostridia bacterium]